ncbi:hypothetical protein AVEN_111700-1 [Araneus ventricosus]|uniref:Uncharacterized protein n=1 Tax=Araneus ventricosus TaxID=182803 RepID=A0A4Y2C7N1_ARAVE|nr:hypothetical protein AVEN_111700-1 [Araneus ventricosus]
MKEYQRLSQHCEWLTLADNWHFPSRDNPRAYMPNRSLFISIISMSIQRHSQDCSCDRRVDCNGSSPRRHENFALLSSFAEMAFCGLGGSC